jgi:hypothetical protein
MSETAKKVGERRASREALLEWYGKMVETHKSLPEEKKKELDEWERANLNGQTIETSDWPGWEELIGKKPDVSAFARQNFRDQRICKIATGETPIQAHNDKPYTVLHIIPARAFDPTIKINLSSLKLETDRLKPIQGFTWSPKYEADGLLTVARDEGVDYSYLKIFNSGIAEAVNASLLRRRDRRLLIPSTDFETELFEVLLHVRSIQKELGVEMPLFILLSLIGVKGYEIGYDRERYEFDVHPIEQDDLLVPEVFIESYEEVVDKVMRPVFDTVWRACGAPGSPNFNESSEWRPK